MSAAIPAIISGLLSLIGIIITNLFTSRNIQHQLETQQAIINVKIEELTRETRQHNDFGMRIPVLESKIESLENRIRVLENR